MNIDIEKIYAEAGVMLTAVGDRWKSPCPFHAETKPSFVVYPDGGYHCFGCGAHGTLQDIAEYVGIDFLVIPDLAYEQDHTEKETKKYLKKVEKAMLLGYTTLPIKDAMSMFDTFDDTYFDCLEKAKQLEGSLVNIITYIRKNLGKYLFD